MVAAGEAPEGRLGRIEAEVVRLSLANLLTFPWIADAATAGRLRADESGDANAILKAMSDYVTSQKSITAAFNTDIEAVTPELQKIQFASSGEVQLIRPDKLHANRTGGYTDVELFL